MGTVTALNQPEPGFHRRAETLANEITELCSCLYAAEYQLLVKIREFDENGYWGAPGLMSCAHWLNFKCGMGMNAARERVRVARARLHGGAGPQDGGAVHVIGERHAAVRVLLPGHAQPERMLPAPCHSSASTASTTSGSRLSRTRFSAPARASAGVVLNSTQAMFMAVRIESIGLVPGLASVLIAMGTPASRKA